MRLSLAFVLSLALAHAIEQPNHTTIRQRQVRRNDTGEPQRIKKLDRDTITTANEKKDKKDKESVEETKESKRKSKNEEAVVESKKNKKDKTTVEAEDKKGSKRSKDAVEETSKNKDKKVKEEEKVKKEKRSIDQKELKNQLKEMQDVENGLESVTIDLGDIMGGSEKDKERKREEKKSKEAATVEIVQEESFESNMLDQEVEETADTSLAFTVEGGRHKHVGFGRKKGLKRTVGGRAGGQKLQGSISSAKAGKEDELLSFRANKYRAGGRNKTKTRGGSGKLRNIGGKSTKITTRGAAYDGKARKMLL